MAARRNGSRPRYAAVPGQARADALNRAAGRVEAAAAELADLIRREVGKPILEARAEVARTAAILRYHAQAALDADGDTYPSADGRSLLMSRRRPRGVVGLITPWNFPIAIPAWKLAPALAYGNVCVWKPSPLAPACAEALLACLAAGAARAGAWSWCRGTATPGRCWSATPALRPCRSPARSRPARRWPGWPSSAGPPRNARWAARTPRSCWPTPTSRPAAAIIAGAAMGYAGQKCTATSRVICEASVHAAMRDALVAAVAGMRVTDPADETCRVGPLITAEARDAAAAAVGRGVEAGGRVLTGGGALDAAGSYLAPALVEIDDAAAELAQEEVFAPVCAVMRTADADAAVALANGVRHGLVTSIFTRDLDRVLDLVQRVDTGLVRVNQPTSGVDLHTPFGGEKASGLGPREQGKAAREFYTSLRTVLISPSC